jgi:predicted negative regulator of RcsB-dependent stress response
MSELDAISQEVPSTGLEKFLEDNFRKLVWFFVILVIALIAFGIFRHQSTLKSHEAAEAFTSAKTVEDCDLVISRYPGSTAAANALLLKSELLWDQNKKSSAVDELKAFTSQYPKHPLATNVLLGLGSKLDAMGDQKEAQAVFERIVNEFTSSEAAPLAQVRLGDLLWAAGKQEDAKKAYEDIAVKFPDMADFQTIGQDRLGWIAASLPTTEVDPPPAPKVEDKPAVNVPKMLLKSAPGGLTPTISPPGAPAAPAAPAPKVEMPAAPAPPAPAQAPKVEAPPAPAPAPKVEAPAPSATPPAPAAVPAPAADAPKNP